LESGGNLKFSCQYHYLSTYEYLYVLLETKVPFSGTCSKRWQTIMIHGYYCFQVVSFDGSTTVEEFLSTLCHEIGCRESRVNGFTLFSDDPIEKNLHHFIPLDAKVSHHLPCYFNNNMEL